MNEDYLKETKTKKSKKPIIVIVVLVLCALGLGGYIVYDKLIKKEPVKTESKKEEKNKEQKLISKLDETKEWVYDAKYEINVEKEKYDDNERDIHLSASNIVAPYINIDSENAKTVNEEIKYIFDKSVKAYNYVTTKNKKYYEEQNKTLLGYEGETPINVVLSELSYKKYKTNNTISIVLASEDIDVTSTSYFTYSFDLLNGKQISYENMYESTGFNSNNIEENVRNAIKTAVKFYWEDLEINKNSSDDVKECDLDCYIEKSVGQYKDALNAKTLRYYVDNDNNLNIIVDIVLPIQQQHFYVNLSISPNKEVVFDKKYFHDEE